MTTNRALTLAIAGVIGIFWITSTAGTGAAQQIGNAVRVDSDDIGGVVTGPRGPEAGVWVIAETTDLPTRFSRTVVTDEQGRYLVPDLPKANYSVWVRGYGLVDSSKVQAAPGRVLNLTALPAPNPRAAAEYYPAAYWYALVQVPAKSTLQRYATWWTEPQVRQLSAQTAPDWSARASQAVVARAGRFGEMLFGYHLCGGPHPLSGRLDLAPGCHADFDESRGLDPRPRFEASHGAAGELHHPDQPALHPDDTYSGQAGQETPSQDYAA